MGTDDDEDTTIDKVGRRTRRPESCRRREDQSGNEFSLAQVSSSKEGGVGTPASRNENAAIRSYQLLPVRWNGSSDRYLFPTSPPNGFVQLRHHSAGTDYYYYYYYYIHRHFFAFSFRTKYHDVDGIAEWFFFSFLFLFLSLPSYLSSPRLPTVGVETQLILTVMLWNPIFYVPRKKNGRVTMISPCAIAVVIDLIEPNGPGLILHVI